MSASLQPRQRLGIVLAVILLMGLHAWLVAPVHVVTERTLRLALGAYCGALGAFAAALAAQVAWLRADKRPGAAVGFVFVAAWACALLGGVGGVLLAMASDLTSHGLERAVGSALLGPLFGAAVAVRQAPQMLEALCRASEKAARKTDPRDVLRQLAAAALAGSGTFALLHPPVRFPLGAPTTPRDQLVYAVTGIVVTGVLLPFAGGRLADALRSAGVAAGTAGASIVAPAAFIAVAGVAVGSAVVAAPTTVEGWMAWRGVVGGLLGATGAAWGGRRALLRK